jgi:hypothetical protein
MYRFLNQFSAAVKLFVQTEKNIVSIVATQAAAVQTRLGAAQASVV